MMRHRLTGNTPEQAAEKLLFCYGTAFSRAAKA
jgi:hypothetical protein